jgi:hypothetical protein
MTTGRRLSTYSRQITDLLREARALAEVPVADRDTDDYRARLASFEARKAGLLAGRAKPNPGR